MDYKVVEYGADGSQREYLCDTYWNMEYGKKCFLPDGGEINISGTHRVFRTERAVAKSEGCPDA